MSKINKIIHLDFIKSSEPFEIKCSYKMTQFPVNLNDATTGHKLQGSSKDHIIISLWPEISLFKN